MNRYNIRYCLILIISALTFFVSAEEKIVNKNDFQEFKNRVQMSMVHVFNNDSSFSINYDNKQSVKVILYGGEINNPTSLIGVECEKSVVVQLHGGIGGISISSCKDKRNEIVKSALHSEKNLVTVYKTPPSYFDKNKLFFEYSHVKVDKGIDHFLYPVIPTGIGIATIYTSILASSEKALVIQAYLWPYCEQRGYDRTLICTDTKDTISRLTRDVYQSVYKTKIDSD